MSWQLLSPLKIGPDPCFVRVLQDVNILSIDLSHQRLAGGSELTLAGSNYSIPRAHLNTVRESITNHFIYDWLHASSVIFFHHTSFHQGYQLTGTRSLRHKSTWDSGPPARIHHLSSYEGSAMNSEVLSL